MSTGRQPAAGHLDEETLRALADGGAQDDVTRAHLATCAGCRQRLESLRALRRVLHAAAGREEAPRGDVLERTLRRLRARQGATAGANELFAALASLLRALGSLLPATPREPEAPPKDTPPDARQEARA